MHQCQYCLTVVNLKEGQSLMVTLPERGIGAGTSKLPAFLCSLISVFPRFLRLPPLCVALIVKCYLMACNFSLFPPLPATLRIPLRPSLFPPPILHLSLFPLDFCFLSSSEHCLSFLWALQHKPEP